MQEDSARDSALSIQKLLDDPMMREYAPRRFDKRILERQLYDQGLLKLDLDELSEMDLEELVTHALSDSMAKESSLDAEDDDAADSGAGAETGALEGEAAHTLPKAQVLIEGMGVEAKVILHKPAPGEAPPSYDELCAALQRQGVVSGIREDFLTRLAERPVYGHKFKIALGKLPVDGEDGNVIFHFDTSTDLSPQIDGRGIADYKALDYAKSVKAGELLCEIIPPQAGSDGFSVRGEVLLGKRGKPANIKSGPNTVLSEDGTQILAACDGQVYLRRNKVGVSRVLIVDRVDASTGNILFVGTVQVRGDVAGGFSIRAGGDIIVRGIVEDAVLAAGGNIILCGGIKGQERGILDAGGSIRTLFIESAKVRVRQNLYADSLINSNTECGGKVILSGRNGCLVGGSCEAGQAISVIDAGNAANIATSICLKNIESFSEQRSQNQLRAARLKEAIAKLWQIVALAAGSGREETAFQVVLSRVAIVKQRMEHEIRRLEEGFTDRAGASRTATFHRKLHPNTMIEIDGVTMRVLRPADHCIAMKRQSRVQLYPIY